MSNQSQISESIDHAYFTSETDSLFVVEKLRLHGWLSKGMTLLEPACGGGALVKPLGKADVKVKLADLIDYGVGAEIGDYLESDLGRYDLVLTNPPFGKMATLAVAFFNKAATNSDRIAFIVPQSFRKISIIDRLDLDYWPVGDYDLPCQSYILPDGSTRVVKTCVQLWEKRNERREKLGKIDHTAFFTPLKKKDALVTEGAYALRGQGSSAGKILEGLDHSESSTRFLVGNKEAVESLDLSAIAAFTAGIPSIGFAELAYAISLQGDPRLKSYLKKGAITLLM